VSLTIFPSLRNDAQVATDSGSTEIPATLESAIRCIPRSGLVRSGLCRIRHKPESLPVSYLIANQTRLINYGRECRKGHRISTARVESTVDQLVDWRMEKKQHMRWTRHGAQMLLHARCALINGELGKYTGWSPTDSSLEQAVAV
jgi:hypothetical protein